MPKSSMIAECLRSYAHWRLDRAEEADDGRNARSAIALIGAAAYVQDLDDSAPVVERLDGAGCFGGGRFDPGAEAVQIIQGWDCDDVTHGPAGLLDAVAEAAERRRSGGQADQSGRPGRPKQSKQPKQPKQSKQPKRPRQPKRSRSRGRAFRSG